MSPPPLCVHAYAWSPLLSSLTALPKPPAMNAAPTQRPPRMRNTRGKCGRTTTCTPAQSDAASRTAAWAISHHQHVAGATSGVVPLRVDLVRPDQRRLRWPASPWRREWGSSDGRVGATCGAMGTAGCCGRRGRHRPPSILTRRLSHRLSVSWQLRRGARIRARDLGRGMRRTH